ncbi:hypothetical protein OBBRIDRAFT_238838 [Obba rivulosa]|uniref:RBR-type E3 ubiquitin transferase n=1 Tax=Obba rivulosa TaxID=1052685 RepID=A0A8E2J3M4_9APHY|nr:hypothetical protein OBBRIDRAFT_238838 [Obba rivulosa]
MNDIRFDPHSPSACCPHTSMSLLAGSFRSATRGRPGFTQLPESSAQTKSPARPAEHDCIICREAIVGVDILAPCGHHYDKRCIVDLFEGAAKDESLYPPRCCKQAIPLVSVQRHMSADALWQFREKSEEFGTLKRVYCASRTCSRFLGPQQAPASRSLWSSGPVVKTCPAAGCTARTCLRCKSRVAGDGHRCVEDAQDLDVLALAEDAGWARCPGCETMVELEGGCFHVTCRCNTEFCYVCRASWKTCRCPQWDERRLLAAAKARADAQLGREAAQREAHSLAHRPSKGNIANGLPAVVTTPSLLDAVNHALLQRQGSPLIAPETSATSAVQDPATIKKVRKKLVRKWLERLRVDDDCIHLTWHRRRGAGQCQNCRDDFPLYLYYCQGCEFLTCKRCRMNRL